MEKAPFSLQLFIRISHSLFLLLVLFICFHSLISYYLFLIGQMKRNVAANDGFSQIPIINFIGGLSTGATLCVLGTRYPTACNNVFLAPHWHYKFAYFVYMRENKCARTLSADIRRFAPGKLISGYCCGIIVFAFHLSCLHICLYSGFSFRVTRLRILLDIRSQFVLFTASSLFLLFSLYFYLYLLLLLMLYFI